MAPAAQRPPPTAPERETARYAQSLSEIVISTQLRPYHPQPAARATRRLVLELLLASQDPSPPNLLRACDTTPQRCMSWRLPLAELLPLLSAQREPRGWTPGELQRSAPPSHESTADLGEKSLDNILPRWGHVLLPPSPAKQSRCGEQAASEPPHR